MLVGGSNPPVSILCSQEKTRCSISVRADLAVTVRDQRWWFQKQSATPQPVAPHAERGCSNDYCSDRSTCSSSRSCSRSSSSSSSSQVSSSGTLKKSTSQSLPSLEPTLCDLADIDEDISATKPNPMYKTSHQLIKKKLERIKAQMEKTSVDHLRRRPERKPYHPFVWNSLSPYRDTYEIDYLIAMSSSHDLHRS